MTPNKLQLNDGKTEVMHISSNYYYQVRIRKFTFDKTIIVSATSIRNLGVIFDDMMTMRDQVTALCRTHIFVYGILAG